MRKAEMEALYLELDKQDEMKDSTAQQIIQKMKWVVKKVRMSSGTL